MSTKTKSPKRSSVNVTPEALHQAQVASAMLGQTMQDFCSQAIRAAAAKVEAEYQKGKEQ